MLFTHEEVIRQVSQLLNFVKDAVDDLLPDGTEVRMRSERATEVEIVSERDEADRIQTLEASILINIYDLRIEGAALGDLTIELNMITALSVDAVFETMKHALGQIISQRLIEQHKGLPGVIMGYELLEGHFSEAKCWGFYLLPSQPEDWFKTQCPKGRFVGAYFCDSYHHADLTLQTLDRLFSMADHTVDAYQLYSDSDYLHEQALAAVKGTR